MPVGARVIDGPVPFGPDPPADARIAQAGACPFGLILIVRRKRKVLVLKTWILLERPLGTQYTPCAEAGYEQQEQRAEPHFSVSIILQFGVALPVPHVSIPSLACITPAESSPSLVTSYMM